MDGDNKLKKLRKWVRDFNHELAQLKFPATVDYVYNPLEYASEVHFDHWRRYGLTEKRAIFMGMNPGPFGMAQTGIPFGTVSVVRDWLKLEGHIRHPEREHPKRPILGFACAREEVSGLRLWGLFSAQFPRAEDFFRHHFVHNYCPLVFMSKSGANVTPDKLPAKTRLALQAACDDYLVKCLSLLKPEVAIGVGNFAHARLDEVNEAHDLHLDVKKILHPSPASPAANGDWATLVRRSLNHDGFRLL